MAHDKGRLEQEERARSNFFFRLIEIPMLGIFYMNKLLFRVLPPSMIKALYDVLGAAVYYARPGMRRRLIAKISDALPEITDPGELRRIGRRACTCMMLPTYDLLLFGHHRERVMRELRVEGMENLEKADAMGKGVILLSAHIGAISMRVATLFHLGKPYAPLMYHPEKSPVPRYVQTLAEYARSIGYDPENPVIWARQSTIPRMEEQLRKGGRTSLTFDIDGSFVVDFFGRPAALASGIGHLALNTGAAVVPMALLRGEKAFGHRMIFYEPLEFDLSGDRKKDLKAIMSEVVKTGESLIREAPDQWMSWFGLWQWWETAERITRSKE